MPKIAAALIVKNDSEVESLRRCLNSLSKGVDKIFITGTQNPQVKIQELCKEFNAEWSWFEWIRDFSAARNYNFSRVPEEYDWIFWCDTDDFIVGAENFRACAELGDKNGYKAIFARYLYQVELDETGKIKNILIEHLRERLIKNDGTYKWIAPIHETLISQVPAGQTDTQSFYVVHLKEKEDMVSATSRNVDILEREVESNPTDPRPKYYLAKAYFDVVNQNIDLGRDKEELFNRMMVLFLEYQKLSGWPEEKAQCWEYIAMSLRSKGKMDQTIEALLEGMKLWPQYISLYVQMALTYVMLSDWSKALHWVKMAMNVEMPKTTLVLNPTDYKLSILEVLYHVHLNTGQLELAQKVSAKLAEMKPDDLNSGRYRDLSHLKYLNDLAHHVVKLANHLNQTKQSGAIQALMNAIPQEIAFEPALVNLKNTFTKPKKWGEDEVVIFCGGGFELWSPKSVAKGVGGSEEAVINMGRELTKLGWKVTVYGDPGEDEGEYDGVMYKPHYSINWNDEFNILVGWRQIAVFDLPIKAKKTYLWNHDIQNPLTYTPERLAKIDKVMFLSKWHRDNVPALPEDKVMYSANGVNI